jgi:hypothetical protein
MSSPAAKDTIVALVRKPNVRPAEVAQRLAEGASVNLRDASRRTPLMWAATRGDMAVLTLLLSQGANVRNAFSPLTAGAAGEGGLFWRDWDRAESRLGRIMTLCFLASPHPN